MSEEREGGERWLASRVVEKKEERSPTDGTNRG